MAAFENNWCIVKDTTQEFYKKGVSNEDITAHNDYWQSQAKMISKQLDISQSVCTEIVSYLTTYKDIDVVLVCLSNAFLAVIESGKKTRNVSARMGMMSAAGPKDMNLLLFVNKNRKDLTIKKLVNKKEISTIFGEQRLMSVWVIEIEKIATHRFYIKELKCVKKEQRSEIFITHWCDLENEYQYWCGRRGFGCVCFDDDRNVLKKETVRRSVGWRMKTRYETTTYHGEVLMEKFVWQKNYKRKSNDFDEPTIAKKKRRFPILTD